MQVYSANVDFFREPDISNSYWAGFLAADGCVYTYPRVKLSIHLSVKDIAHVEKFCTYTDATNSIRLGNKSDVYADFSYPSWVNDLGKNWNVVPNKTDKLLPPNITDEAMKASYIVGYIDGDGCWDWHTGKHASYLRLQIEGGEEILRWIDSNLPVNGTMVYRADRKRYYLRYVGRKAAAVDQYLKLLGLPRLERKWWPRGYRSDTLSPV